MKNLYEIDKLHIRHLVDSPLIISYVITLVLLVGFGMPDVLVTICNIYNSTKLERVNMDDDVNVIEAKGLTKDYNGFLALKDFSLNVPKHSIFAFLGPNGAGKTTTIRSLLGLIRPTSGGGRVLGYDILNESIKLRRRVGYLAQNPSFYDKMTARQTLNFVARFFYKGQKDLVQARVAETLELVGLDDKADRPIRGFSGGETQRLGIAQAQINWPKLLVLDEPAAGLDPHGRETVLEVMERLRKHATVFYSTHILDDVQRVSDTVAIINKGQLIAEAPIKELIAGQEGVAYTVVIKGDPGNAYSLTNSQDWVTGIQSESVDGKTRWFVSVTDEEAAEDQLLRLVMRDERITVTEFKKREYELEQVFMKMVEESEDDN
jgi:ABC-2 type transport system ATP-binding protein